MERLKRKRPERYVGKKEKREHGRELRNRHPLKGKLKRNEKIRKERAKRTRNRRIVERGRMKRSQTLELDIKGTFKHRALFKMRHRMHSWQL